MGDIWKRNTWVDNSFVFCYLNVFAILTSNLLVLQLTRVAETFDVEEKPLSHAEEKNNNVHVIQAAAHLLNTENKVKKFI